MSKDWAEDDSLTPDEIRARVAGLPRAKVVVPGNVRTGTVTKVKTKYTATVMQDRNLANVG